MAGLTMFGKTYDTVGSSNTNLLLRTKGDLKIQWGNTFIDLVKDGKINSSSDFYVKVVESEDDISHDGIYLVSTDESTDVWVSIKGEHINLSGGTPKGAIMLWQNVDVPDGWAKCDGANNTPDMTNLFIKNDSGEILFIYIIKL